MDKEEAIKIAERYAGIINQRFPVEKVVLYGSYSKGTHHADSVIDLAVIFKSLENVTKRLIEIRRMRNDDSMMIEPYPFSQEDFCLSNPVAKVILKTGIEIKNFAT